MLPAFTLYLARRRSPMPLSQSELSRMALEVERKFLLANDSWRKAVIRSDHFQDGLIARFGGGKVRVRRAANTAWLAVKGPRLDISRSEFEYEIPLADADEILSGF